MNFFSGFAFGLFMVVLASCSPDNLNDSYRATGYPDRIMLNLPGDPAHCRAVTWRTSRKVRHPKAQFAVAGSYVPDSTFIVTVDGETVFSGRGISSYKTHKVIFRDLKPGTRYVYRVGDGNNWSEWNQFMTSASGIQPFSFLYFGDVQNGIREHCSRVVRQAFSQFSGADFFLFTGDLVNGASDRQWQNFYNTGGWIFSVKPTIATPGNHEFTDLGFVKTLSSHWDQFFVHPSNGPESLVNRMYYLDYQGVRFISLDGYSLKNFPSCHDLVEEWLSKVLGDNPNKWTIVMNHYPVYSCTLNRDNRETRDLIKPLLERFNVDLVLQGHDHTYCRGKSASAENAAVWSPVYVVSVAGPKANDIRSFQWGQKAGSDIQLYQYISVSGDSLSFSSWAVNQKLFDAFTLVKRPGQTNLIAEGIWF